MLLGLADYLQLAVISVSFDSSLSLLPCVLSFTHHAGCWAPFCPETPLPVLAAKPEGYFGAVTCCPGGPARRGFNLGVLLHLSFPGGSLISFALQSRGAGCAVPLPK